MAVVKHKESIHSGQFMVSNFDAEDEDDGEGPSMTNDDKCTPDTIETEHGQAEFKYVLRVSQDLLNESFINIMNSHTTI